MQVISMSLSHNKEIKGYYTNAYSFYDYLYSDHIASSKKLIHSIIKRLKITKTARVIDPCCGSGSDTLFFLEQGFQVAASDLSEAMVKQTKKKLSDHHFKVSQVFQCDAAKIDQKLEEKFDLVCFRGNTIAHIDPHKRRALLESLLAITKGEGKILLDFRNGERYIKHCKFEQRGFGYDLKEKCCYFSYYLVNHAATLKDKYFIRARILMFNLAKMSFSIVRNDIWVDYVSKSELTGLLDDLGLQYEFVASDYKGLACLETMIITKPI